jgi:Mlc titration factor MtfA (ptsG expression regulator)
VYFGSSGARLRDQGLPAEWSRSVVIFNAAIYLRSRATGSILLHELSHAYHHRRLGFDYAPVLAAYQAAMAARLYEEVATAHGEVTQAYATTNEREYFAELSEAWFHLNDYFPFTRSALRDHDPQGSSAIEQGWFIDAR